jgi:hypothetical protein
MTPATKDRTALVPRPDGLKDCEWPVCGSSTRVRCICKEYLKSRYQRFLPQFMCSWPTRVASELSLAHNLMSHLL